MNDFKSLLNVLNQEDEQSPLTPEQLAQMSTPEPVQAAPIAAPKPVEQSVPAQVLQNLPDVSKLPGNEPTRAPAATETVNSLKTSMSGTIPTSDKADGSETAEARLERLMRELNEQRNVERDEASNRKFKADVVKAITDNIGTFVGGMQAKNTKAAVNPVQTKGYDVGDLVGQVDKKFSGDREALLDQYKQLLNARDRSEQRKYQQDSLEIQREGNRIKARQAEQKANKLSNTLTPGEKKVDENFAKDYNTLTSKGFNNAETAIGRIEAIADELEANVNNNFVGGGRSSLLPDALRNTDSIRWRDAAQNEANATLKELFPGSLSDDERRAAAKEYYNDKLSNAENAKILRAKAKQLRQNVADQKAKANYFSEHGTLKDMSPPQSQPSSSNSTIRIQGPSGQIAEVSADKAEKYLSKPGYKRVD